MKLKNSYFYTIREDIKEEDTVSGNLLVRSGMIRKTSAGIYMFLPLGLRVLNKIQDIVREEMNSIDSTEVLMPALVYEDYYAKSGRKAAFGPSVFTLKDRNNKPYVLGPTHEELFALASSYKIKSYKDLPFSLYQFQNKFRDEPRPRFGLIRVREFIMKDAYTFDKDYDGLDISYNAMFEAYKRIFNRMNLDYRIVKADTGVMGGLLSEEFQAVTEIGEDTLVMCTNCDYASNLEVAEYIPNSEEQHEELQKLEKMSTPNVATIEDLINTYNFDAEKLVKCLIYTTSDNEHVMALSKGTRTINEIKLAKVIGTNEVVLAEESVVNEITGARVGFAGPVGLDIKIFADNEIKNFKNFVVGANEDDHHYINVNLDRDFNVVEYADITVIEESDNCPICGGKLEFKKGIEVGNTFKLGTKYAETMNVNYLDQDNKLQPVVMGSYGIGIGRCMASIVEQKNDEFGIVWPESIAPFKVALVVININDEIQMKLANDIYNMLIEKGIDVIMDDRDERPGVKFKDMDLIGIPTRITIGKKASENIVELKYRNKEDIEEISKNDVINKISA